MDLTYTLFSFVLLEVLLLLDEVLSAAVDVKTLVSVQEFLQVSEGDMHGFFEQQGGGVACMVKDPCLVSERLVVFRLDMLCNF